MAVLETIPQALAAPTSGAGALTELLAPGRAGGSIRPHHTRPHPVSPTGAERAQTGQTAPSLPPSRSDSPAWGKSVSNKLQSLSGHEATSCRRHLGHLGTDCCWEPELCSRVPGSAVMS